MSSNSKPPDPGNLILNAKFCTADDVCEVLKIYEQKNFVKLYRRSSRQIDSQLKRTPKRTFNQRIVFTMMEFRCVYGGREFKSRGKGKRNKETLQQNCPFKIVFEATKDGEMLELTTFFNAHSHPVNEVLYNHLPQNRRMDEDTKDKAKKLLTMNANKRILQSNLMQETGKVILMKDLYNLSSTLTKSGEDFGSHLTETKKKSDAVNTVVTRKSQKCYVSQLQSSQNKSKKRTKTPEASGEKLENATKKPDSPNWGMDYFIEWLEANGLQKQFELLPKGELDQLLARLYGEVHNEKGQKITKTAYILIRDAIQKHLESSPWNIDYVIKTDPAFSYSNIILDELEPLDCPLKPCDVEQLVKTGTVGMHNPTALQNLVWISIALHLGKLNVKQWIEMTKSSFVRSIDERGMDYIGWSGCSTKSKLDVSSTSLSTRGHIKIYALPHNPLCPVKAFDMYMSLLHPATNDLWQKPRTSYKKASKWYHKKTVRKRTITDMMKNMCLQAKLSKLHSNNCLHITSSTILMEAEIQESDIQVGGPWSNIGPRRRKLHRENEGFNWQEENQTHSYEGVVTVNNVSSSPIYIKCEDIKDEDENPLAFKAPEDIEDGFDEGLPLKRIRLGSDGCKDNNVNEVHFDPFADDVCDDPRFQHMKNSTASSLSQKQDIYDSFAGQIANTLRDLNDQETFRRVKLEISNIMLNALLGKYKNTSDSMEQNPNLVTSGADLQNVNLATSGPIIQNQNSNIQKPLNLGQLVNNPMNLWQLIKNPQMPQQIMLKALNQTQMRQIVGNIKQTVFRPATTVTSCSVPDQVTSTLTHTPVSKSGKDT